MPNENQTDPRKNFVSRVLPWLLGLGMLAIYALTLNRWVTLLNVGQVANLAGWVWQPQLFSPLMFLVTYPFRWLPAAAIPLALNLFSAVCAALTLVLLARSVTLLPHDRTEAERQREKSGFGFLTGWPAWFPPVLAVLFAGLQLTFWQHATNFTGESFDLLLFAAVVWLLLEYRLDEQGWRLTALAFLYGAGMAENWALVGFLPLFLAALLWLRRLEFFNLRFLSRMVGWGMAGLAFLFLLPLAMKFSGRFPLGFWEALKPALRMDWLVMKALHDGTLRHNLALVSLTTLLPLLVLSLRWSATFGDNSRIGSGLANNLIHFVFAVIFGACVWIMFDSPFSPRQLSNGFPYPFMGTSLLPLYYLAALAIGYYCGYFLLVFGKKPIPTRRNSRPDPILPGFLMWLCPVIVVGVLLTAAIMAGTLVYKNSPVIREVNDSTLMKYAAASTRNLPRNGGILLCDSDNISQDQTPRAFLVQAMLAREGRARDFLVVDTQSLNWAPYHRFLHERFPGKWPLIVNPTNTGAVSPVGLLGMLNLLSKTNALYYLNPSYGYYFEQFYQEPHGVVYAMKPLPETTLVPPLPDKNLIAENESFWTQAVPEIRPAVEKALKTQTLLASGANPATRNPADWLLRHLHAALEANPNALFAGTIYSRALNCWGVRLQRAGELDRADDRFQLAQQFNPDNVAAAINDDFNRALRAGAATAVKPDRVTADQFGRYRTWNELLNGCGPFDDTSFCFEDGALLVQGGLFRQAIAPFARVRQLAPDNLAARLWLAQLYLFNRLPDRALEAIQDPLTQPRRFSLTESNSTELNVLASAAHFQKDEIPRGVAFLETEIARHPDDDTLLTAATQAYFMRGLYTNALRAIERKLIRTPDDPQWLFGKGYANLQISNYDKAITAMTRVLEISTNDPTARFNRALAYLQSDKLDLARADYLQLQTAYTNSFQVAFGLAEVAWRQHHTNDAVRNYQLYLANAPTNSAELKTVRERLVQLRGP